LIAPRDCGLQSALPVLRSRFDRVSKDPDRYPSQEVEPMSQNYDRLVSVVQAAREDVEKADAGNKAATARVRKSMQEIKEIAQEIRKEMLEKRDAGAK
jgi:hypothetical protein